MDRHQGWHRHRVHSPRLGKPSHVVVAALDQHIGPKLANQFSRRIVIEPGDQAHRFQRGHQGGSVQLVV